MANLSKMTNLKSSVDSVLASMLTNGVNVSDTQVGIVPFNTQVKIAPGTGLSYINYGGAVSGSEGCKSGTNGYMCNTIRDGYNKVCKSATTVATCKANVKAYQQTYTTVVGGVTRTYYNTVFVSYLGSNVYTYSENTYTTSVTTSQTPVTTVNAETGATSTSSSSKTTTTQYLESQAGTSGTDMSVYTNAGSTTSTCFSASSSATCFTAVPAGTITYNNSYGSGYGAAPAVSTSTNSVFGSSAGTMWLNIPAIPDQSSQWTGCVYDRTQNYDTTADPAVATNVATLYPARTCDTSTLLPVQPLNNNIAAARTFVQSLVPGGNTNITIGVQWGMEVLSPDTPMTGGVAFGDPTTKKYMIIVTDGDNTQSRYSSTQATIDARTALACTNAKALGITVFTVKVITGNSTMLQTCASQASYFYDLSNASQLNTALSSIFDSIKKLRLTQ